MTIEKTQNITVTYTVKQSITRNTKSLTSMRSDLPLLILLFCPFSYTIQSNKDEKP